MQKIVINAAIGGFSLSHEAIRRYAQIKGMLLFPEKQAFGGTFWWKVPKDLRLPDFDMETWKTMTPEQRLAYNKEYVESIFYPINIARDDPVLVQVVEELGEDAGDREYAYLKVVEIPDGVQWEVQEREDGTEYIAEQHRTWS